MIAVYTKLLRRFALDRFPRKIRLPADERLLMGWEYPFADRSPWRRSFTTRGFMRFLEKESHRYVLVDFFRFFIEDPEARRYLPKHPHKLGYFQLLGTLEPVGPPGDYGFKHPPRTDREWEQAGLQILGMEHLHVFPPHPASYWADQIQGHPHDYKRWRVYRRRQWHPEALEMRARKMKRLVRLTRAGGTLSDADRMLVSRTAKALSYRWTASGEAVDLEGIREPLLPTAGQLVAHLRVLLHPTATREKERKTKFGQGVDRDARMLLLSHVSFWLAIFHARLSEAQRGGILSSKVRRKDKQAILQKLSLNLGRMKESIGARDGILPAPLVRRLHDLIDREIRNVERMCRWKIGESGGPTYGAGKAGQERYIHDHLGWFVRNLYPNRRRPAVATVQRELRTEHRRSHRQQLDMPRGFDTTPGRTRHLAVMEKVDRS